MYFAKDELIEINNNDKYLVLDTAFIDDKAYYKIQAVNETLDELIGDYKIVTATNENGSLYINDNLPGEEINKLKELFES